VADCELRELGVTAPADGGETRRARDAGRLGVEALEAVERTGLEVFRLARTRVLAAFPRVVSHSSTDFGSVNGKIGVALGRPWAVASGWQCPSGRWARP